MRMRMRMKVRIRDETDEVMCSGERVGVEQG